MDKTGTPISENMDLLDQKNMSLIKSKSFEGVDSSFENFYPDGMKDAPEVCLLRY